MKKLIVCCSIVLLSMLNFSRSYSCTGIRLKAKNGAVVYARTLEFGIPLPSTAVVVPRGYLFMAFGADNNKNGMAWKSKYAFAGVNAAGKEIIMDGVNEKGLGAGAFYLAGFAGYQDVPAAEVSKSISSVDVVGWLLSNFANVEEVKQGIGSIKVNKAVVAQLSPTPVPLHYNVHDAQGNAIVIEYVGGELHVYDNPLGVLTNSPTFDWHMTNLRNYVNLSPVDVPPATLEGIAFKQTGLGSGLLGLPGDFTPPSRFVRAVAYSQSSVPAENAEEAVDQAFHILNAFDIPKGVVRNANETQHEYTLWTSASDLQNKRFYFHTYRNREVQVIDLMKMNINGKNIITFDMDEPQSIETLTSGTVLKSSTKKRK
ncbi:MAG TPA: choloylglycine hydrolase family protein [Chitinophaga sp.]|uniref:choloylglycine hydrolase family protein n=1 Tax=Chitinophaga sp. TaxID=1869181 RepID=UPI002D0655EC|nr:choloylglycine hydrolase family protein [Chitinophaga sp.]HVI48747.1 choloylglycine hydrolase family protein [Chitinophaga sp.]